MTLKASSLFRNAYGIVDYCSSEFNDIVCYYPENEHCGVILFRIISSKHKIIVLITQN
jgi:hypothetical protein